MERSRVGDSGAGCWRASLGGCQGLGTGWCGRAPWPWGSATRPLRALGKFYLDASGTEHDISACHQVFIAAGTSSVGRCLCRGFLGVVAPPPRARCPRRVLLTPECLRRWRAAWRKPLAGGALPTGSPVPAQVTKACEPCPGICDGPKPRLSLLFPLSPPPPNIAYGKLSKYCASGSFMCCLRSLHFPDWPGTAEQVLSRSPAGSVRRGARCLLGGGGPGAFPLPPLTVRQPRPPRVAPGNGRALSAQRSREPPRVAERAAAEQD